MAIAELYEQEETVEYYWIMFPDGVPIIGEFVSKTLFQTRNGLVDVKVADLQIEGPIDPPEFAPVDPEPEYTPPEARVA